MIREVTTLQEEAYDLAVNPKAHKERLAALRTSLETQHSIVEATEQDMTEETPAARAVSEEFPDQEDVDHMN
jgi:hypothetical protein